MIDKSLPRGPAPRELETRINTTDAPPTWAEWCLRWYRSADLASKTKRNYLHVRDAARAFLHGLKNYEAMAGGPYNVGLSDANLSKKELCEKIKVHVPRFTFLEAPVGKDPDQRNYIVSNAKMEATGWRPKFSLDAGIAELVKGFTMIRNTRYGNV